MMLPSCTVRITSLMAVVPLLLAGCISGLPGDQRLSEPDMLELADRTYAQGDWQTAEQLYRDAFEQSPRSIEAMVGLGRTYIELGQISRGRSALLAALDRRPHHVDTLFWLARADLTEGNVSAALITLDEAIAIAPSEPRLWLLRGVALDALDRHEEAQTAYLSGLDRDPTNFGLRVNLASSLGLSGNPEAGLSILQELEYASEADESTWMNLARLYFRSGQRTEALAVLERHFPSQEAQARLAQID